MAFTLAARRLVTANKIIDQPLITIEGPNIVGLSSRDASESTGPTYDFEDATLMPGLLDIHGAVGHDVMEGTIGALHPISQFLASHGVTQYLATDGHCLHGSHASGARRHRALHGENAR